MPENKKTGGKFMEMLDGMVERSEITALFNQLKEFVLESKTRLEALHSQHMQEMAAKADKMQEKAEMSQKQLSDGLSTGSKQQKDLIYSESRTLLRMMEQKIADLEAQIPPEYQDGELRTELENIKKSIPVVPPQFDASDILSKLTELFEKVEKMEKDIEELKKRPVGRVGGGVSAMGVAQAFKWIAKTEAPVGDRDGVNTTYTVSSTIWWIAGFTLNGEQIAELPNFTYANKTITFATAIPAAYANKDFEVKFIGT